jgi:nitronate monooxygenase
LRQAYRKPDGTIGWRCPGERVESYVQKGGRLADTHNRKCICNALVANVGMGQVRHDGQPEPPLVTCGNDVNAIAQYIASNPSHVYHARDVIEYLLSGVASKGLVSQATC